MVIPSVAAATSTATATGALAIKEVDGKQGILNDPIVSAPAFDDDDDDFLDV